MSTNRVLVTPADRIAKLISVTGPNTQTSAFTYPATVLTIVAPTNRCARPAG